jgi:hypothetical protein
MPIVFFSGGIDDEQARGGDTLNSFMRGYVIRRDDPLNMIFIGGHEISDAPTYNETVGLTVNRKVSKNGRNVVREEKITGDVVKSVELNLLLPNRAVSVTDRIYQMQANCDYDIVFVPTTCDFGCDRYFLVGEDATFGTKKLSNGILGYDDNEQPIEWTRTVMFTGNFKQFNGMEVASLASAAQPLYSVLVLDSDNTTCQGCDCPYQTIYRGGEAVLLEVSTDGGATWTAVDTTAIPILPTPPIITSIISVNGRIIFGYSDVADAVGTAGGVAYIDSSGVAVVSNFTDSAGAAYVPLGTQNLINAGGKVYAFGSDGEILISCDGGLNFVLSDQTTVTDTILTSDYDSVNAIVYLGTIGGGVFGWDFTSFTDYTVAVGTAGDVTAIVVPYKDQVQVYDSLGALYENFGVVAGKDWIQTGAFGSAVYGAAGDSRNYRTVAGAATTIFLRDLNTLQSFEEFTTLAGNVTQIFAPAPLEDEGESYFVVVTDTGETIVIRECGICLSGGCS